MTLVVARRSGESIRMSADLRISDRGATKSGFVVGALKVVILNPDLCVGFAGPVGRALVALRAVAREANSDSDLETGHQTLLDAHRASGCETDFLVASRDPVDLARIAGGGVETGMSSAGIGDPDAFAAYQVAYHGAEVARQLPPDAEHRREELDQAARMSQAMRAVIDDDSLPTVGETVIEAASTPLEPGFRYAPSGFISASHEQIIPAGEEARIEFGNAAQGGFAYAVLVPDNHGIGAVGIHFFQGRLGLYYDPLRLDRPEPFPNVTHDEFRAAIQNRYGVACS